MGVRRRLILSSFTPGRLTLAESCLTAGWSGSKQPTFDLTPVSGAVTLDGKPLPHADVAFYLQGAAPAGCHGSVGMPDAQGKFELQAGLAQETVPVSYKVTVSCFRDTNGGAIIEQEGMALEQLKLTGHAKETVPPEFSDLGKTRLAATVEEGKSDGSDFTL